MQFNKILFAILFLTFFNTKAQENQFISKIFEYNPAPGQFINTAFGFPYSAQTIIGGIRGGVTLGAFGGYIVVGFDNPVENNPDNPYGIDFTVFGNAWENSKEPAAVYVMKDENNNGLPDDTWYLLAGADYWFDTSVKNYEITYYNPGGNIAKNVYWDDNNGNTGVIPANEYHTQPYYPLHDSFPDIPENSYTLRGIKIIDRLDTSNISFITSGNYPFGFADNMKRNINYSGWEPDNPYTKTIEGTGGDAFDISWAVDSNGDYIELDKINFIKIQTAVNKVAGWLGELSSEVTGIVDVNPDAELTGESKLLVIQPVSKKIKQGKQIQLQAFVFLYGKLQKNENIIWKSSDNTVIEIDNNGLLTAKTAGSCSIIAYREQYPQIKDSIEIKVIVPDKVNIQGVDENIIIYPNPVSDKLFIKGVENNTKFVVFDITGKVVNSGILQNNYVSTNNLPEGMYVIKIFIKEKVIQKKFIVNP